VIGVRPGLVAVAESGQRRGTPAQAAVLLDVELQVHLRSAPHVNDSSRSQLCCSQ
jgi:hypothetical protein